jgi:uncharacterized repeat protein (TIGR01451 family)
MSQLKWTFNDSKRAGPCLGAAALCLAAATPVLAQSGAGTIIVNTAILHFDQAGKPIAVNSNTVTLTTAEILDVTIAAERDTGVTTAGVVALPFHVTNTGNGPEGFTLTAAADQNGVAIKGIVADTDGDGVYTAGKDAPVTADAPLALIAGQSARIFVLVDGASVTTTTNVSATVTAVIGSGAPGTIFAGKGVGGGDAIVGKTGATATAHTALTLPISQPTLLKEQSVLAPDGSAEAVHGAVITYRLTAHFPDATPGVSIDDALPAGTQYVPGSLHLDQHPLTDVADSDAGTVDASAVHVALGQAAAASTHIVQFSVTIQ